MEDSTIFLSLIYLFRTRRISWGYVNHESEIRVKIIETKRILVVQLRQLGDILLTTPAVRAIKSSFPESEITFLTHKMGDLVLRGNPYIDQILTYSDKDTFFDTLRLLSKLRKMKFELAIDFMFNPRSALLTFLSSAKTSYSIDSRRGFLYHKTFPRLSEKTYIVNEKLNLLKQIGIKGCGIELDLSFTPEDTEPFKIFLK